MRDAQRAQCRAVGLIGGVVCLGLFFGDGQVWAEESAWSRAPIRERTTPSHSVRALEEMAEAADPRPHQNWQVLTTTNFRIMHLDPRLARRVARVAEQLRASQLQQWTGGKNEDFGKWSTRCDLMLYPSFREMIGMTGGQPKAGSAVVRPSKLYRGRILSRRVNLVAKDRRLFQSTLPHEVTHVVLGDLLGGDLPLWANEGAASVAEGPAKRRHYRAVLRRFRARGQLFAVQVLMNMRSYPDDPYKGRFYAQSASLIDYLISLGGRPDLLAFLSLSREQGVDWALRYVYEIAGIEDLEGRWLAHLARR